MSDFVIIPDTSCDLIKPLRERFGITDYISGLIYFPDGHCEKVDLDWNKYDPKWFYESMSDKKTLYKKAEIFWEEACIFLFSVIQYKRRKAKKFFTKGEQNETHSFSG